MKNQINLPSDKLIVEKIKERTKFFNYLFSDIKYFISGSFLMNSVFSEHSSYSDIDIYFPSKHDYTSAQSVLNSNSNFNLFKKTKYATTYHHKDTGIFLQLVKKNQKNIKTLALSHDFANCALAIDLNNNSIFISKKAVAAWSKSTLDFNASPLLKKGLPSSRFFNQLNLFYIRIKKYTSRYKLTLSKYLKGKLEEILSIHRIHLSKRFNTYIKFYSDYANAYYCSQYSQLVLHNNMKAML